MLIPYLVALALPPHEMRHIPLLSSGGFQSCVVQEALTKLMAEACA
jgi:hypothetical protein